MSDRDRTDTRIATILGEEAARLAPGILPPLEELQDRATGRRRRRWALGGAAGLAAAAVAGAVVWATLPASQEGWAPPADGPVSDTFRVPTYDWDPEQGGNAALVAGTLALTDDGCPLLVEGGRATALILPNASGVTYDNGVRGVVDGDGRVYAVEGQTMEYAGGWSEPVGGDLAQEWEALCGDTPARDAVVVNDVAAHEALGEAPDPPAEELPTAPSTAEELGWFEVPTYDFADSMGQQALIEGTVEFTDEGCPYVETDGSRTGLVFPNAEGFDNPDSDDPRMVYAFFGDGSSGLMAQEGEPISWGGGAADPDDERWTALCSTPVDGVFIVQDTPFQ